MAVFAFEVFFLLGYHPLFLGSLFSHWTPTVLALLDSHGHGLGSLAAQQKANIYGYDEKLSEAEE